MKSNDMIKQYLILAGLLIIGLVILLGVDFDGFSQDDNRATKTNQVSTLGNATSSKQNKQIAKIDRKNSSESAAFNDLRIGGSGKERGGRQSFSDGSDHDTANSTTDMNQGDLRGNQSSFSTNTQNNNEATATESLFANKEIATATTTPFDVRQFATSTPFQRNHDSNNKGNSASSTTFFQPGARKDRQDIFEQDRAGNDGAGKGKGNGKGQNFNNDIRGKSNSSQAEESFGTANNEALPEFTSDILIGGRVLNSNGSAIIGLPMELKLIQASDEDRILFGQQTLSTQSNAQGEYLFVNLVAGQYRVCAAETASYNKFCQNSDAPHTAVDFSLKATANGRVQGKVVDEQGLPMKEVSISAAPNQKNRIKTDESGRFDFPMLVSGELSYQLFFNKKEFAGHKVSIKGAEILKGKNLEQEIVLKRFSGFDVKGFIRDQSGNPVVGQYVSLYSRSTKSGSSLRAQTDNSGAFTIKYVTEAEDYRLNVSPLKPSYVFDAAKYAKLSLQEGASQLQIELENIGMGSIQAVMTGLDGKPLANKTFTIRTGSAHAGRATTDENGYIEFKDVTATQGKPSISISSISSAPSDSFSGITLAASEYKSGLSLKANRGQNSLDVFVIDENQQALGGARATLSWTKEENGVTGRTRHSYGKTSDAASGIISFSNLGSAAHRLQINLQGYRPFSAVIQVNLRDQPFDAVMKKL